MGDFDLAPPPMPGEHVEEKKGFLRKLFSKKQPQHIAVPLPPEKPTIEPAPTPNLDDIKRKLGILEEPTTDSEIAPIPSPYITESNITQNINNSEPAMQVKINDWSQDIPSTESTTPANTTGWERPSTDDDLSTPIYPKQDNKDNQSTITTVPEITQDTSTVNTSEDYTKQALEQVPEHHALIEQHLADIDREHEKIEKKLQELNKTTVTIPDWSMQPQEITPDQHFLLRNGQTIKSLAELCDALNYVDDITFEHHVNDYRNDFANWIRDIIKNPALADKVLATHNKEDMLKVLLAQKQSAAKTVEQEHKQIQKVIAKRKEAVEELLGTEKKIALLHQHLKKKSAELIEQKGKHGEIIKKKLDAHIAKKLSEESHNLKHATASMTRAKQEHNEKLELLRVHELRIAENEKRILLEHSKLRKEQEDLKEQKREIEPLLHKSEIIKTELHNIKKHSDKNEKLVKEVKLREENISRVEQAIHAKEKKLAADITKNNELKLELTALKQEVDKRKEELQKIELDAKKLSDESRIRRDEALAIERASRERIAADTKKLAAKKAEIEKIKLEIEKNLRNTRNENSRVTKAVELRKKYDAAINETKKEVVQEREKLDEESYVSLIKEKIETTPIGQPENLSIKDVLKIKHVDIYNKIVACRQALETKDINKAKAIYNELRDAYAKADLGQQERETLYTDVRELYDDIHLMMLG